MEEITFHFLCCLNLHNYCKWRSLIKMLMQGIFKVFQRLLNFSNKQSTQAPLCNTLHVMNFSHRYEATWLSASWEPCCRTHHHTEYFTVRCPGSYYRKYNRNRKLRLFVQKQSCTHHTMQEEGRNECCQGLGLFHDLSEMLFCINITEWITVGKSPCVNSFCIPAEFPGNLCSSVLPVVPLSRSFIAQSHWFC